MIHAIEICPTEREDYPIAKCSVKNSVNRFLNVLLSVAVYGGQIEVNALVLRCIATLLLGIWLSLMLLGKGGFIHLFLLSAIGVSTVDVVGVYRSRMTA